MEHTVDVAILGGGLAGNLLARQLRREAPDLSVALFERETERSWKVGESTVEIAAAYLTRRLGLTKYLYEHHLPKNGLRFFFDDETCSTRLEDMSEIGLMGLPPYPSFQLDRARLERDLLEMNARDGVDVHVGTRVLDLQLDDGRDGHTFRAVADNVERRVKARWVVDATGRGGIIARQKKLTVPERSHRVAATWARFEGVADIDDWPAPEWRARVRHTARYLSTNHFCYPDQWIWFIPLREGVTSVGVVAEASSWDKSLHTKEGFLAHMGKHRTPAQLIDDAELLDIGTFTQLAFRTKQFWSAERWASVGDAAAFVDPFYSPGSDFIAIENDIVADLINREARGEDIRERAAITDEFMHFRFDTAMALYEDQYRTFGSFELFKAKVYFDCACYYNLWFDSYERDEHIDLKAVKGVLRRKEPVVVAMENFRRLFRGAADELMRRGDYYRMNTGIGYHDGQAAFGPIANVGAKRRRPVIDRRTEEIFNETAKMVQAIVDGDGARYEPRPIWDFAEEGRILPVSRAGA
jgi:flavin-dependent dehydrogenase